MASIFGVLAAGDGWDARFTAVSTIAALRSFLGPTTYGGFTMILLRGIGGLTLCFPDQCLGFGCFCALLQELIPIIWAFRLCSGCVPFALYGLIILGVVTF